MQILYTCISKKGTSSINFIWTYKYLTTKVNQNTWLITCVHGRTDREARGGDCREAGGGGSIEGPHVRGGALGLQGLHAWSYGSQAEAILLNSPWSLGGGGIRLSLQSNMS